jgi:hypothetical protein
MNYGSGSKKICKNRNGSKSKKVEEQVKMFDFLNPNIGAKVVCDNNCGGNFYEFKGKSGDVGKLKGKYRINIFSVCRKCGKKYCSDCFDISVRRTGCDCGNGRNGENAGFSYKTCLKK